MAINHAFLTGTCEPPCFPWGADRGPAVLCYLMSDAGRDGYGWLVDTDLRLADAAGILAQAPRKAAPVMLERVADVRRRIARVLAARAAERAAREFEQQQAAQAENGAQAGEQAAQAPDPRMAAVMALGAAMLQYLNGQDNDQGDQGDGGRKVPVRPVPPTKPSPSGRNVEPSGDGWSF